MAAARRAEPVPLFARDADDLADRLRRRSAGWWSGPSACPGWTRADVVAHLVAELAGREHALTGRDGPVAPARPDRPEVLADQLAVVAADLRGALATVRPGAVARRDAAYALGELLLHHWDVDRTAPRRDAAAAVLSGALGAEPGNDPAGRLLALTGRTGEPREPEWRRPGGLSRAAR